jgi:hypothetical protein
MHILPKNRDRLEQLKRDIALDRYAVDASDVADAIVWKLRLVRRAQEALAASSGADRTRAARPAHRPAS